VYIDLGLGFRNKRLYNYFVRKDVVYTYTPSVSYKLIGVVEKVNNIVE